MKLFSEAWFLVKIFAQLGWSVLTAPKFVPAYPEAEIRPYVPRKDIARDPVLIEPRDMICCGLTMQYDGARQKYWCRRCQPDWPTR